ncbi:MAG: hypothetical protein MUP76_02160 [Acidimicrobiia bacterium]|nr:hypothetical protein [Acidimicrobiia bacterium]
MTGRGEIREVILGAAEGARGSMEALGATGLEDFDVEVVLSSGHPDHDRLAIEVHFSIAMSRNADLRRSVA